MPRGIFLYETFATIFYLLFFTSTRLAYTTTCKHTTSTYSHFYLLTIWKPQINCAFVSIWIAEKICLQMRKTLSSCLCLFHCTSAIQCLHSLIYFKQFEGKTCSKKNDSSKVAKCLFEIWNFRCKKRMRD